MIDTALSLLHQSFGSPWVFVVLFTLAALDGFFPVIPGETSLIATAVFAASSDVALPAIILAGAAGAFAGDHVSYLLGRFSLGRFRARIRAHARGRAADDWASAGIAERGGQVLLASRYVPGVRTATTITMGGVGYPLRRFTPFDAIAATLWAAGWSLVGHLGGVTFGNDPLKGLVFGLALALVLMVLSEAIRRLWHRRRGALPPPIKTAGTVRDLIDEQRR